MENLIEILIEIENGNLVPNKFINSLKTGQQRLFASGLKRLKFLETMYIGRNIV